VSGPEHYQEAEKALAAVDFIDEHEDQYRTDDVSALHHSKTELLAEAQVHATLALAAAQAARASYDLPPTEAQAWLEVIA